MLSYRVPDNHVRGLGRGLYITNLTTANPWLFQPKFNFIELHYELRNTNLLDVTPPLIYHNPRE